MGVSPSSQGQTEGTHAEKLAAVTRDQLWDRLETSLYLLTCHFARKQRVKTRLIKIEKEHML